MNANNMEIRYAIADTLEESQQAAHAEAQRRFGRLTMEKLEAGAQKDLDNFKRYASRAVVAAVNLGLRLIAAKSRYRGDYGRVCEQLGLSQPTAWRFQQLAIIAPLLPESPPDAPGSLWSMDRALTFAKEFKKAHRFLDSDIGDDELPAPAAVTKLTGERMRAKRHQDQSSQLSISVTRLAGNILRALDEGDLGAPRAIDAWRTQLNQLDAHAKALATAADRQRDDDEAG